MPKFLLSLVLICATTFVWAQDSQQEKLEQRKAQIQQEIRDNEKMLQSVRKKEKSAVNEYLIQANKIKLKEKLINTTAKQEKILSNDMYINQVQVNKLKKELAVLKEDYAKMIVKSYKSRSEQSRFMFVLSSTSFLQAYKRIQYMKQYAGYRKRQAEEIILPTETGEMGVLKNHAPIITGLDVGAMLVRTKEEWNSFAVMGGFAVVKKNQVTILANEAESAESIDAENAKTNFEIAIRNSFGKAHSPIYSN